MIVATWCHTFLFSLSPFILPVDTLSVFTDSNAHRDESQKHPNV